MLLTFCSPETPPRSYNAGLITSVSLIYPNYLSIPAPSKLITFSPPHYLRTVHILQLLIERISSRPAESLNTSAPALIWLYQIENGSVALGLRLTGVKLKCTKIRNGLPQQHMNCRRRNRPNFVIAKSSEPRPFTEVAKRPGASDNSLQQSRSRAYPVRKTRKVVSRLLKPQSAWGAGTRKDSPPHPHISQKRLSRQFHSSPLLPPRS